MLKDFLDLIAFDTTTPFNDLLKKQELSGTISSGNTESKTILVYDRLNGELIKTANPIKDNSFLIKCPYRDDESLTMICRDEGGDFNADIYDKLSLCTAAYQFPPGSYYMVEENALAKKKIIIEHPISFIENSFNRSEQNHKNTISKFEITNNIVKYMDQDNTIVEVNYSKGMTINNKSYVDNKTIRFSSEYYVTLFDMFNDSSAEVCFIFGENTIYDISGNYMLYNNKINYKRGMSDLGGECISMTYGDAFKNKISFKYNYTPRPTTISFWMYFGDNSLTNVPIIYFPGGFHLYTNYSGSYLYFQTASTNTAWNAAKSWSIDTNRNPTHVSIAFGDGNYSLYINGLLLSTQAGLDTAPGLTTNSLCFFDRDVWYAYVFEGAIQNFRIFNKILDATEMQTVYEERLIPSSEINNVSGHSFGRGISQRRIVSTIGKIEYIVSAGTLEDHSNVNLLMSFNCDSLGENSGMETVLDNVSMFEDKVYFNGSGLLHKAPKSSDVSGNYAIGSESDLDILCRFKPTRTDSDEILWKSGDSTDGLAVGIKNGEIGIYGASSSTLSSITMPVSNITINEWNYIYATDSNITLMDMNGNIINEVSGTVTAGNATAQESIGGASEGSPMTTGSSGEIEHFIGDISDVLLYQGGSSIKTDSMLKIAATVENTGNRCIIEEQIWNPVNNSVIAWITIPNLSSTIDNNIRIFFDKDHWDNPEVSYTGVAPTIPDDASVAWVDLRNNAESDIVASFTKGITGGINTLTDWDGKNKIKLTLTPHDVYATNIPVKVHLTNDSYAGALLMDSLLKDGVFEYKKIAIEYGDTKSQVYAEIELASYTEEQKYPIIYDSTTVKAIDYLNIGYYPWYAVDPSKSLIDSPYGTSWCSKATALGTLERTSFKFNVDLGSPIQLKRIILENLHYNGTIMTYLARGIRKFKIYGTNDSTAFENLDYFNEDNLTLLGKFHARKHIKSNVSDPQEFSIEENYLFFRYYIIRIENGYSTWYTGFRDIDFIGVEATLDLNILVPIYSDVENTILNLYPDISKIDNTSFVDDPGETAALEVWNHGYTEAIDEQGRVSIKHDPVYLSDYVHRTLGDGQVVTMTIPASFVDEDLVNFPFPVYMSTSTGTNTFDFSELFIEMKQNPSLLGTKVESYKFGGLFNKENNFYTDNMNFSFDESQNNRGIFKFDNDPNKHILIKYTDEKKFPTLNNSVTFWIELDRSNHVTGTYYGVIGTTQLEGFQVYLYNHDLYIKWSDGVSYRFEKIQLESYMYGPWIHITISFRPFLVVESYIEIKINGEFYYKASSVYSPKMGDFMIGGCQDISDSFYGRIHSLRVWDKWLSDEEATIEMNSNNIFCPIDTFSTSLFNTIIGKESLLGESLSSIKVNSENDFKEACMSISFDRLTYKVYLDDSWIPIVTKSDIIHGNSENTDWFFYHDPIGWVHSGTDLCSAMSSAMEQSSNWMNYEQTSLLTQTEFDLEFNTNTGICEISVSMRASSHLDNSIINSIIINDNYANISEEFSLDDYNEKITSSRIEWRRQEYNGIIYNPVVSVLINGDTSWSLCTNGSEIPGIISNMNTIGKTMIFKTVWPYSTPDVVDKNITLDFTII